MRSSGRKLLRRLLKTTFPLDKKLSGVEATLPPSANEHGRPSTQATRQNISRPTNNPSEGSINKTKEPYNSKWINLFLGRNERHTNVWGEDDSTSTRGRS